MSDKEPDSHAQIAALKVIVVKVVKCYNPADATARNYTVGLPNILRIRWQKPSGYGTATDCRRENVGPPRRLICSDAEGNLAPSRGLAKQAITEESQK